MLTNKTAGSRPADTNLFRIAHISDLHVANVPNVAGWTQSAGPIATLGVLVQILRRWRVAPTMTSHDDRCARALLDVLTGRNRHRPQGYDACIVTGDLATTGSREDLATAAAFLRADPSAPGAETLRPRAPLPKMVLLPGNHDRYSGRALWPRSVQFEDGALFGGNWDIETPRHSEQRAFVNSKVITNAHGKKLAIVKGDFSYVWPRPDYFKTLGGGKARKDVLREMDRLTAQFAGDGIPVIWAIHYPPVKKGVKRFLRLGNYKAVIEGAGRRNIEVILCGHTHDQKIWQFSQKNKISQIQVICAGSACEFVKQGTQERTYYELQIDTQQGRARLAGSPLPMIYSAWQERIQVRGRLGIGAEFCPAP